MKKISLSIILILSLFILTGCYDAKSIENYSYAVGIAIDKSDTEIIKLSIQFAESSSDSNGGSSQSTKSSIVSVDCDSINAGISIINNYLNRKINLAHCSVIVFSEKIAKEGIEEHINTLTNNIEIRPSCNIIISKSTGLKFLETAGNSSEQFSSRYYEYILNSSDFAGYTIRTPIFSFFSKIKDDTGNPIAILSSTSNKSIQNAGIALFKDNIMVGDLSTLDTIFYLIVTNQLEHATISIDSPFDTDKKIDVYLKLRKETENSNELINNSPYIKSKIYVEGQILSSTNKSLDYSNKENLVEVEKALDAYLEEKITGFLYKTSKDYDTDICGFGKYLIKKCLTEKDWQSIHWKDIYKNSSFDVNVESNISSSYLFIKQ